MARYTYYGFNLTSGDIIAELPLRGAAPQWAVNDPGDLGGPSINLSGLSATKRTDVRAATVPYRCGIAVERDRTIIWTGVVTARRYSSTSGAYALTVPGLLAYWRRRPVSENRTYAQTEQFDIVTDLLTMGGGPTIPLDMSGLAASGVPRDRTLSGTDAKSAYDTIMELADNLDGYEIAIASNWSDAQGAQRIEHRLRLGSPRLGQAQSSGGVLLMLEYPGNVREYTWDEDGEEFATEVWGTSTGSDGTTWMRAASNLTLIAEGFPRVATTRQWDNIVEVSTLDEHIAQALIEGNGYQDAPTFKVLDDGDTAVGQWVVGDDMRIRVTDPRRFPDPSVRQTGTAGLDTVVRLQSATLDPEGGTVSLTAFAFAAAVQ